MYVLENIQLFCRHFGSQSTTIKIKIKTDGTMTGLLTQHHPGENISIPEAAFRWIYNHSALDGARGDAVVLGASRLEQVATNLELSRAQPLHQDVVTFMDDWWKSTKHLCPQYFR